MEEYKGTARCYLLGKVIEIDKLRILIAQNLRVIVNQNIYAKGLIGVCSNLYSALRVGIHQLFLNYIKSSFGLLGFNAGFLYLLNKISGATIHNGHFGSIDLYEGVIDAKPRQGGQNMLNGGYANAVLLNCSASRGVHHIIGNAVDGRFTLKIGSDKHIPCIFWRRTNLELDVDPCVQALACKFYCIA